MPKAATLIHALRVAITGKTVSRDGVKGAGGLLSEAIRIFRQQRSIDDIAGELTAAADNLDEDAPLAFIRP